MPKRGPTVNLRTNPKTMQRIAWAALLASLATAIVAPLTPLAVAATLSLLWAVLFTLGAALHIRAAQVELLTDPQLQELQDRLEQAKEEGVLEPR